MRILLSISLAMLAQVTMAQNKKIIFVCQHGAAKSVIAASYFNKLAKERNLNYTAECRGIEPDSAVSVTAMDGLTRDGVFDPSVRPQKLLAGDTVNVERIILFAPLPPAITDTSIKTENWSQIENVDADYTKRRNAIIKKINELLDSLEKH